MRTTIRNTRRNHIVSAIALMASLGLALAGCGGSSSSASTSTESASSTESGSSSSSSSSTSTMSQLAGITATGKPGKKPTISFHTPMTVQNNTYAVLQKGDGATIQPGDRVCSQGIAINAKDGSELMNTWTKNTPDCSLVVDSSSTTDAYYKIFKGAKINSTIAFGVNDSNSSGTSYILAMTLVSKTKALTRATGTTVKDIPSDLPKVTLAKNGKPSLSLNGYKPSGSLVAQTLIKGTGDKVTSTDTVSAHYTGWYETKKGTLKQFDSSWDSGSASSFSLSSVVKGWTKGLTGQTVGSQVLLVIPPDLGYGSDAQKDSSGNVTIPANSTLYFVVDILYAYAAS